VNLDDDPESTEAERLPPPLQPQVVTSGSTPSRTMCRSLSDFLSNLTETACTNSSFAPTTFEITPPKATAAVPTLTPADSSVKPLTTDETAKSNIESFKPDEDEKNLSTVSEIPEVSVTAEDTVAGLAADDTVEENSASQADDSASVSSLLLDSTVTSNVDISLLDDPFIAIGAGCEKDSLLGEQDADASWTTDDPGFERVPMTSSPDSSSGEKYENTEVASPSIDNSAVFDTVADTEAGHAAASSVDDTAAMLFN